MPPSQANESVPRVLIVDDDVSVTDTFSRMLRLEGYEVWAALSADEGLSLAQTHRPHAVILDLRMPLTSGLQFLRAGDPKPLLEALWLPPGWALDVDPVHVL